jgi:glycerophosphoryl diester phosphodiesterase
LQHKKTPDIGGFFLDGTRNKEHSCNNFGQCDEYGNVKMLQELLELGVDGIITDFP